MDKSLPIKEYTRHEAVCQGVAMNKLVFASLVGVVVLVVSAPVSAASQSAAITDPVGDAALGASPVPDYQDIVAASVSEKGHAFTFSMELAAAVPDTPSLTPDGVKLNIWVWPLTTDLDFSARGDPLPPGLSFNNQFDVRLHWDGTTFSAFLLDRRPLATGGEAVFAAVPFSITGAEIRVFVDAAAIGNPMSFFWFAFTADWLSPHFETGGFHILDFASPPDGLYATWPS